MFPDVLLYGDTTQNSILQGWELKMPDVPITDSKFIADAQRKASALKLNSCLIWNFTNAILFEFDVEKKRFVQKKTWNSTAHIRTRDDVRLYQKDWQTLLEELLLEINRYFLSYEFHKTSVDQVVSNTFFSSFIEQNKGLVADVLKSASVQDSVMDAFISDWFQTVQTEFQYDESDKNQAYAKSILLNWLNRIAFAHLLKGRQQGALRVNELQQDVSPAKANEIFREITSKCDFFNIFSPMEYDAILPKSVWKDCVDYSALLGSSQIEQIDPVMFQNILDRSVAASQRALNGQFATPEELSRILARITVRNWNDNVIDCCCGSGTIAKTLVEIKKEKIGIERAYETTWASDKYEFPLQIANIRMLDVEAIDLPCRLFQSAAEDLEIGRTVEIVDPKTGKTLALKLPLFGAIVSNLPFVSSNTLETKDKVRLLNSNRSVDNGRADLYFYLTQELAKILKPGGTLGIVVSNSWLGTNAGKDFLDNIRQTYQIKQIHLSGQGKWFQNADVVATIVVLEKHTDQKIDRVPKFFLWKRTLSEFENDKYAESKLVNSSLLEKELEPDVVSIVTYPSDVYKKLLSLNVSHNALFHNVGWFLDLEKIVVPINHVFNVFRGCRRGYDQLFFPSQDSCQIEPQFLKKVQKNARSVDCYETLPSDVAFCCSLSLETLKKEGCVGAIKWIEKFSSVCNEKGKPLPEVLSKKGCFWYELKETEIAEIFTTMNPERRFFFTRFKEPSFINQRLVGFNSRSEFPDVELNHILLNSIITIFSIEASGFGRGLGVLDVNKDKLAQCLMINPQLIETRERTKIVRAFEKLKKRKIRNIDEELLEQDRVEFEKTILDSVGMGNYFEKIRESLFSMQKTRLSVKTTRKVG